MEEFKEYQLFNDVQCKWLENFNSDHQLVNDENLNILKSLISTFLLELNVVIQSVPKLRVKPIINHIINKINEYEIYVMSDDLLNNKKPYYIINVSMKGIVNNVTQFTSIDVEKIKEQCQLRPLPVEFPLVGVLHVKNKEYYLGEDKLTIKRLYGYQNPSHDPFGNDKDEEYNETTLILPLPSSFSAHGLSNHLVFVAGKYAWGLNLSTTILDIKNKILYLGESYNFDHPEGIACCLKEDSVLYYLDNDQVDQVVLYNNKKVQRTVQLWHCYKNSGWEDYNINREIEDVRNAIIFSEKHPSQTIRNIYDKYWELGTQALHDKNYPESIRNLLLALECPGNMYPSENMSDNGRHSSTHYQLACAYSLNNNQEASVEQLLAAEKAGWTDWNHMSKDSDLINVHRNPIYQQLISKYVK